MVPGAFLFDPLAIFRKMYDCFWGGVEACFAESNDAKPTAGVEWYEGHSLVSIEWPQTLVDVTFWRPSLPDSSQPHSHFAVETWLRRLLLAETQWNACVGWCQTNLNSNDFWWLIVSTLGTNTVQKRTRWRYEHAARRLHDCFCEAEVERPRAFFPRFLLAFHIRCLAPSQRRWRLTRPLSRKSRLVVRSRFPACVPLSPRSCPVVSLLVSLLVWSFVLTSWSWMASLVPSTQQCAKKATIIVPTCQQINMSTCKHVNASAWKRVNVYKNSHCN